MGDPELAEIERNPDSIICSPDATGPADAAALATPAAAFPPAAYPSPATTAAIWPDARPADCARLVQRPRLIYFPQGRAAALEEWEAAVRQCQSCYQPWSLIGTAARIAFLLVKACWLECRSTDGTPFRSA